ncbi:RAD50-interacting protein 1-like [Gigantopelta aegis]|uniref:RAD50-interacting protein 1-like n=1 Tax=Gigantopelta aegis TaxID=1735272 RepID=UPI001B88943D|nr:RAD50-interacting protein 1-like [Gigantopelta aegis]
MKSESSSSSVDDFVVEFLNSHFGDDARSISKAKSFFNDVTLKKEKLEKQVSLASSEVPAEIKKALKTAQTTSKKIKKLGVEQETLRHDILDNLRDSKPMVDDLSKLVTDVRELERYAKYLSLTVKIEDCSSQIQTAMITESMQSAVDAFDELIALYQSLEQSQCANLIHFTTETILFWNNILQNKIATEFEDVLKAMRWPLVATTIKAPPVTNAVEVKAKMECLFKQLLHLDLVNTLAIKTPPSTLHGLELKPLILPLHLMLRPLKKRFIYHFYGKKQTNSLDKPEWYFTQILSWIRDHSDFLQNNIQPLLTEFGKPTLNARVEFIRGLTMLAMEKLSHDLPELCDDEHVFSHLVDETLLFDRELRLTYSFPTHIPGCLHVLSSGDAFTKWLSIEKKFALEKIDAMLSSPTAWLSQYKDIVDVDELKVPECGESFMTLLTTITERYKPLPEATSKLQFLGLQLELLEDFRIRIVQVMKQETHSPTGACFSSILNAVHYVIEVLREWSELVFFLQLQYARKNHSKPASSTMKPTRTSSSSSWSQDSLKQPSDDPDTSDLTDLGLEVTVFDDMINLYESIRDDMLKNSTTYIFTDIQARSQPYRKDRWLSLASQKDLMPSLGLSPSACEMLLVLKGHLAVMETQLSKPLFTTLWQTLAQKLNKFILQEVILPNHFNDGGAAQLSFDMTRNLFPLFGEYTQKPDSYFREVKEACILLTLTTGSAILLKEVLHTALHEKKTDPNQKTTDPCQALHELGVYKLSPEQVERILRVRTDV